MDEQLPEPRYIGDGVYASFDGYQWWLRTETFDGTQKIALEPVVMKALEQYVQYTKDFYAHKPKRHERT